MKIKLNFVRGISFKTYYGDYMHEYVMTGRVETDKCLKLANKAHNFYFINPLYYKEEFAKSALDFFQQIEKKFTNRTGLLNVKEAIKKHFGPNTKKAQYISTELFAVEDRLKIIIKNPSLINEKNVFLLDHTARFIEIILPYVCSVKEEVENNRKFSFSNIVDKEFIFFMNNKNDYNQNDKYLQAFYDNSWRAQKELNGFKFIKRYLDLDNPIINKFYTNYGGYDCFSSLIFARMANEQFMKYLTNKHKEVWFYMKESLPTNLSESKKEDIVLKKNNDSKEISLPVRIDAICKAGILDELIAREVKLINSRGNNIAHEGISGVYSSCYHNLEVLDYLNKYCK